MAGRRRRAGGGSRGYERTDRLAELLREIVAEQLERIEDERLVHLTITGVSVDRELERAHISYTCLHGDELSAEVTEALAEHRGRLRKAVGDQARIRRVPELVFEPDATLRAAERIDEIIRDLRERHPDSGEDPFSGGAGGGREG